MENMKSLNLNIKPHSEDTAQVDILSELKGVADTYAQAQSSQVRCRHVGGNVYEIQCPTGHYNELLNSLMELSRQGHLLGGYYIQFPDLIESHALIQSPDQIQSADLKPSKYTETAPDTGNPIPAGLQFILENLKNNTPHAARAAELFEKFDDEIIFDSRNAIIYSHMGIEEFAAAFLKNTGSAYKTYQELLAAEADPAVRQRLLELEKQKTAYLAATERPREYASAHNIPEGMVKLFLTATDTASVAQEYANLNSRAGLAARVRAEHKKYQSVPNEFDWNTPINLLFGYLLEDKEWDRKEADMAIADRNIADRNIAGRAILLTPFESEKTSTTSRIRSYLQKVFDAGQVNQYGIVCLETRLGLTRAARTLTSAFEQTLITPYLIVPGISSILGASLEGSIDLSVPTDPRRDRGRDRTSKGLPGRSEVKKEGQGDASDSETRVYVLYQNAVLSMLKSSKTREVPRKKLLREAYRQTRVRKKSTFNFAISLLKKEGRVLSPSKGVYSLPKAEEGKQKSGQK